MPLNPRRPQGGKSVEVRPVGVTKGAAMLRTLGLMGEVYGPGRVAFDFVLCIGASASVRCRRTHRGIHRWPRPGGLKALTMHVKRAGHLLARDEDMYTLFETSACVIDPTGPNQPPTATNRPPTAHHNSPGRPGAALHSPDRAGGSAARHDASPRRPAAARPLNPNLHGGGGGGGAPQQPLNLQQQAQLLMQQQAMAAGAVPNSTHLLRGGGVPAQDPFRAMAHGPGAAALGAQSARAAAAAAAAAAAQLQYQQHHLAAQQAQHPELFARLQAAAAARASAAAELAAAAAAAAAAVSAGSSAVAAAAAAAGPPGDGDGDGDGGEGGSAASHGVGEGLARAERAQSVPTPTGSLSFSTSAMQVRACRV